MPTHFEPNDPQFQRFVPNLRGEAANLSEEEGDDALWDLLCVYTDGEATPEESARVEAMLRTDPAYARDFAFLRKASESVQAFVEIEPPAALHDAILNATLRRPSLTARLTARWNELVRGMALPNPVGRYATPIGAVAVAGLLVVGLGVLSHRSATSTLPSPNLLIPPVLNNQMAARYAHRAATPQVADITPSLTPFADIALSAAHIGARGGMERRTVIVAPTVRHLLRTPVRPESRLAYNPVPPPSQHKLIPVGAPLVAPLTSPEKSLVHNTPNSDYKYVPGMETETQHIRKTMMDAAQPLSGPEVAVNETTTKAQPTVTTAGNDTPPTPKKQYGRLLVSELPPDSRHILTCADMRRERAAETMGYDRSALQSISRKEAIVSLIGGRF